MLADARTTLFRLLQVIAHELANKGRRLRRVPMRGGNLRRRQPDKAVTAFQRMVEESEFVVGASVASQSDRRARSTARGFLSTP
jgi:hypothetical protein